MARFFRGWECGRCRSSVSLLFYCSSCWKLICKSCYDPYVGVCKDCIEKLLRRDATRNSETDIETVSRISPAQDNTDLVITDKCEECKRSLIITPDGTKCCPLCGLVVGPGYSWIGSGESGKDQWSGVLDNIERILEERVSKVGWG